MATIDVGTLLGGKYRLEKLIGRGGMGSVWRAEHLGLTAPIAIKLLDLGEWGAGAEALARFHREARAAASIRSPHVVQILDHGIDQELGAPYIVMELMEGESLAQRLTRQGHISPGETARVMTHVARALSRAHDAGIVHRDLKPDNVFLVRNEDEEVAKVLDFGIAKAQAHALGGDSGTRTGAVMGTAYYMSPEQISGQKTVDLRTDLWALGVMAYECITGLRPFDAESIGGLTLKICIEPPPVPSQHAQVPTGFDQWFLRSVNRDPAQRFGSAREAAESLRGICSGGAPGVSSGSAPGQYGAVPMATPAPYIAGSTSGAVIANTAATMSRSSPDAVVRKPSAVLPVLLGLGMLLVIGSAVGGALLYFRSKGSDAKLDPNGVSSQAAAVGRPAAAPPEPTAAATDTSPAPSSAASAATTPSAVPSSVSANPLRSTAGVVKRPPQTVPPKASTTAKPKPPASERDVIDDRH